MQTSAPIERGSPSRPSRPRWYRKGEAIGPEAMQQEEEMGEWRSASRLSQTPEKAKVPTGPRPEIERTVIASGSVLIRTGPADSVRIAPKGPVLRKAGKPLPERDPVLKENQRLPNPKAATQPRASRVPKEAEGLGLASPGFHPQRVPTPRRASRVLKEVRDLETGNPIRRPLEAPTLSADSTDQTGVEELVVEAPRDPLLRYALIFPALPRLLLVLPLALLLHPRVCRALQA